MLDRKIAPAFVQSTSFELLTPVKKQLSNGIDLFFISGGAQEVLRVELLFKAGRWFEKPWGASYFTSHLLSKGTKHKSSFQIAQVFDRYGAHFEVTAGMDGVSLSLYTLTKHLSPVLDLLAEIVQQPVFPVKELEQTTAIFLQNLKVNHEKTSFLASKFFRKNIFGENHPYGKEIEEHDIQTLQQADLVNYFHSHFQDLSIFVSGKIEANQEKNITDLFSGWHTSRVPAKLISPTAGKPFHQHIEKEGSVQSSIRMGRKSLLRTDPDYISAVFASHILGGYFGSRLMKNIREEKGLTYGIHASLHPMKHDSYMMIGADVNKENVTITLAEIRKELKRLRTEAISPEELETSRSHFIGSLQAEITTPFAHADKLKNLYLFGLRADFYQQMISIVDRTTPEQLMETCEKHFHEESFNDLTVG
jgi:zinc protease